MWRNSEGYEDPTAGQAISNICREQNDKTMENISRLIHIIKQTAELAGFDIVGRVTFKDKATGKEWK